MKHKALSGKKSIVMAALGALLFGGMSLAIAASSDKTDDQAPYIQLLGTKGGPSLLTPDALPQSTAIVSGDDIILVDAGYGASYRMLESGLDLSNIREIFITHMHSDHVLGYPALLMNSWATGLEHPIEVYGAPGIKDLTRQTWKSYAIDINKRVDDEGRPDPRKLVSAHEIDEGPIDTDGPAKVEALRVNHPPFKPGHAFAYRFQIDGKTIVFTGDLGEFPKEFTDFARNADVLISEAVEPDAVSKLAKRVGNGGGKDGQELKKAILSHHVTTKEVGQAAAKANVKKVVLSHLVPADDPKLTAADWKKGVKKAYDGPVVVGKDGMQIELSSQDGQ